MYLVDNIEEIIAERNKQGKNLVLFDIIARKNKSKLFESVFIDKCGSIGVGEDGEAYLSAAATESGFKRAKEIIAKELTKTIPELEKLGFFNNDGHTTMFSDEPFEGRELIFYTTPFYCPAAYLLLDEGDGYKLVS